MGDVVTLRRSAGGEPAPLHVYGRRAGIEVCLLATAPGAEPGLAVAVTAPATFGPKPVATLPATPEGRADADVIGAALAEALDAFALHAALGGLDAHLAAGRTPPDGAA